MINSVVSSAPGPTVGDPDDLDELDDLIREQNRRQVLEREMEAHEQRRVSGDPFVVIPVPLRASVASVSRASTSDRFASVPTPALSRTPKISVRRRIRDLVKSEAEESFIGPVVVDEDEDEPIDEDDEGLPDCMKCCRVPVGCQRVVGIACARCSRQKVACVSVCFRSASLRICL